MSGSELPLRYGVNPHQRPARASVEVGRLPFAVLNGAPSYVNLLDALNSWQLVRELRERVGLPAAASFKHVSPAGAAVAVPLDEPLRRACFVANAALSPLAQAYARARGADRVSSYGDWAAVSDRVDVPTARLLLLEVSDGVVAPAYEPEALRLLAGKRQGSYVVIQVDPAYVPAAVETRDVFGVRLEQPRNSELFAADSFQRVVTGHGELPESTRRDMLVALVALKYTQSNSVCLVRDGGVIGMGAGQQSRIHCTRLAADKADTWWLRQHPAVLDLRFRAGIGRTERDNAIDGYLRDDLTTPEEALWQGSFDDPPARLAPAARRDWLDRLDGVTLGSDAYIPFRDNIDRASRSGARYVVQPGGSSRDADVIRACQEYGMTMVFTGVRLFHH